MWTTLWLLACITTEDIDARLDPDDDGVEGDDDCAPENADVHPGADEVCNGVDDDCDGVTDGAAALDAVEGFEDRDADGFGGATRKDCPGAASFVTTGGDCDDDQAQVRPGAEEVCNGVDDDCDGETDGASSNDVADGFMDEDGDGFGGVAARDCPGAPGFVQAGGDCDDTRADVQPDVDEVCGNGRDDDCDPTTDCRWLGGVGTQTSASATIESAAQAIATADMDGDGVEELIAATSEGGGRLHRFDLEEDPSSELARRESVPLSLGAYPHLVPGDFDDDGADDLVVDRGANHATLSVFWASSGAALVAPPPTEVDMLRTGSSPYPRAVVSRVPAIPVPALVAAGGPGNGDALIAWDISGRENAFDVSTSALRAPLTSDQMVPIRFDDLEVAGRSGIILIDPSGAASAGLSPMTWTGSDAGASLEALSGSWAAGPRMGTLLFGDTQGDVDGDGLLDMAIGIRGVAAVDKHTVSLVSGGAGVEDVLLSELPGFETQADDLVFLDLELIDGNHDGLADVAVLVRDGSTFQVRLAYGPLPAARRSFDAFDAVFALGTGAFANGSLTSGDLNGDGHIDWAAAVETSPPTLWANLGRGQ